MHGAKSPQAKRAAAERLLAAIDPALGALEAVVRRGRPDTARVAAAHPILDRAGLPKTTTVGLDLDALARAIGALHQEDAVALADRLEKKR